MSDVRKLNQRELRKRLLRLEAESYRLEMLASVRELRNPNAHLHHAPMLLGWLGGNSRVVSVASALLANSQLQWLLKAVPLALAGWRIAQQVNRLIARRAGASP